MDPKHKSQPKVVAIIPARYHSNRFEGKPIAPILGKPMIQHVYERAIESGADNVVIATDDQRVADHLRHDPQVVGLVFEHLFQELRRVADGHVFQRKDHGLPRLCGRLQR